MNPDHSLASSANFTKGPSCPDQYYLRNSLVHKLRRKSSGSRWEQSFSCTDMRPLIICRGPIRLETMTVFEEMGIEDFGILLSEKDSITYANALSPELRKHVNPSRVHRVQDYNRCDQRRT